MNDQYCIYSFKQDIKGSRLSRSPSHHLSSLIVHVALPVEPRDCRLSDWRHRSHTRSQSKPFIPYLEQDIVFFRRIRMFSPITANTV
jgi:hypothetical protein